jgi:hypothetical protein
MQVVHKNDPANRVAPSLRTSCVRVLLAIATGALAARQTKTNS